MCLFVPLLDIPEGVLLTFNVGITCSLNIPVENHIKYHLCVEGGQISLSQVQPLLSPRTAPCLPTCIDTRISSGDLHLDFQTPKFIFLLISPISGMS